MTKRAQAAAARRERVRQATDRPSQRRSSSEPGAPAVVRGRLEVATRSLEEVERDGVTVVRVPGYASITEEPYVMHDAFGEYSEIVSRGAFAATLLRSPAVEYVLNHGRGGGAPMAHTRNGTLELVEDEIGLRFDAYVDPSRSDVADHLRAIERGDLADASFRFRIDAGRWSPDYDEFRIESVDLDRGDVSSVNFGANPAAYVGRSAPDLRLQLLALALAG